MTTETKPVENEQKKIKVNTQGGGDTVYGLGLFGAWAFYLGRAATPEEKVKGFFKAFIWPATLVYELLKFFNKEAE